MRIRVLLLVHIGLWDPLIVPVIVIATVVAPFVVVSGRPICCQTTTAFLPDMCKRGSVARAPRVVSSRALLTGYVANAGDVVATVGGGVVSLSPILLG